MYLFTLVHSISVLDICNNVALAEFDGYDIVALPNI